MKVVVIGGKGQLGTDLVRDLSGTHEVVAITRDDVDVRNYQELASCFSSLLPHVVVNTAAFHQLSACESNPEEATLVNAKGAQNVARAASAIAARTVYISTDYVFSGKEFFSAGVPTSQEPDPLNAYGLSKLRGELATLDDSDSNLVVRISSVFGSAGSSGKGGNFIETILRLCSEGLEPEVVSGNAMSPTYTVDAARAIVRLIEEGASGYFHASNAGYASWYELASRAIDAVFPSKGIREIEFKPQDSPQRPRFTNLDTTQLRVVGIEAPHWEDALTRYLKEKGHV